VAIGTKLSVADIRNAAAFYQEAVGLLPTKRNNRYVSFGPISLVEADYARQLSGGATSIEPSRRNRLEIRVGDLDRCYVRVRASGVAIVQEITDLPWGGRAFHCLDRDGNLLEIAEET